MSGDPGLASRLAYYAASVPTLLAGIERPARTVLRAARGRTEVALRDGLRLSVRSLMDLWIMKETCLDRCYERASVDIGAGWTVVDIGAGVGDFAVSVAVRHPDATVIAYEPDPAAFEVLQVNVAVNRTRNVTIVSVAVGGRAGGQRARDVDVVTLDRALHDLPRCEFLKVDCEGAEFDVFRDASPATLAKVGHICLEYHDGVGGHQHAELTRLFTDHGFAVTIQRSPVHASLGLMYARNLSPPGR